MDNKINYGLLGAIFGGAAVWLFLTTGGAWTMPNIMFGGRETQNLAKGSGGMDQHFIEQMIPHHEDAITMAKLALTQAQHPEIKQLSESIIDSQSKEIDLMREWYKEWFGREVFTGTQLLGQRGMMSGGMHMGMMGGETDITRLEQAADFDKVFIEEMIPHHQMAVMMASMLQRGTQRPEMQKLAQDIISAQTSEIDQMGEWYSDWH